MKKQVGAKKTELKELPRIGDRVSFIYIEHAKINKIDSSITITDYRGTNKNSSFYNRSITFGPRHRH